MRLFSDRVLLSATDLNTFLGCRHASALDFRKAILGEALEQAREEAGQALVKQRGEEHERQHFHALRAAAQGEVVWLRDRTLDPGLRLTPACCMGPRIGRVEPYPCSGSRDPDILRASKVEHAVQDTGSDAHFGRLPPIRLGAQPIADDAFPSRDIGLHQSAPVVPCGLLPAHAAALGNAP